MQNMRFKFLIFKTTIVLIGFLALSAINREHIE